MARMLVVTVLALLCSACSSGGDRYDPPGLREVTAANQCMEQCQRHFDSCMTSSSSVDSSDRCGAGVATQRDTRCDTIDNPDLRKRCQASADYCRNRLPALTCGENRSRCVSRCGG